MKTEIYFNGSDYVPSYDQKRLTKQIYIIKDLMLKSGFVTLQDIENVTGFPQASISAQLRNLKKERFGGYILEKRRTENKESGTFEYKLSANNVN